MKIAFLTPEYPHSKTGNSGGIGTSIKNLAKGLLQQGCQVRILVYGQKEDAVFEDDGIIVQQIRNVKFKGLSWYLTRKKIEKIINQLYADKAIDLVEAADWTGITAFMNLKAPVVIRFHGSDAYFCYLEHRKQKLKNFWLEKLAINKAQSFIAPTYFAGELSKKLFGIKNKNIETIPNGVDLDNFENTNPLLYEKGLILYIGTIIRKKGVLELPAIFNKVRNKYPEARLVLIGSDSYDILTKSKSTWKLIQQECSSEDLSAISYFGKIPYGEVQEFIKKANVCVFPTFAETLGMVTIESMALQKSVVNSNIGWAKEIIEDGVEGFLVHPKDHKKYAERILELLENSKIQKDFGKAAREKVVLKFSLETVVQQNLAFYSQVIELKSSKI